MLKQHKFYFGQEVIVFQGFYKTLRGQIISHRVAGFWPYNRREYKILILNGLEYWIREKNLDELPEHKFNKQFEKKLNEPL